jgi:hypothetical protein
METLPPPQLWRQQLHHCRSTLGIVAGGKHPDRLVEQQGERVGPGRQRAAVDADLILGRICSLPEGRGAAVQTHPTLPQQLFGPAAGADPGGGDQLLQSFGTELIGFGSWKH